MNFVCERCRTNYWTEGVATAPKDYNLPQHPQIETKNLYVRAYNRRDIQWHTY